MKQNTSHPKTTGTALLEALLTVTIVSFGVLIPLRSFSALARNESHMTDRRIARYLAAQEMTVMRLKGNNHTNTSTNGVFEPQYDNYSWSFETLGRSEDELFTFTRLKIYRKTNDTNQCMYTMQSLLP